MLHKLTSKDGTTIAYDLQGEGPPVILVCGGSVDRGSNAGLADALAHSFTVYNYDRRGRGDSGDTPPYAVEREVEDIDALVAEAGGSAFLFGSSSGAALALIAAHALGSSKIARLALWEPPFILDESRRPPPDTARIYTELVAEGRRGDAAEYFMAKVVGLPPEFVAQARQAPWWPQQEALAHTLAYDATIMADYSLPEQRAAEVSTSTIVLAGSASFPFMLETGQELARRMPDARYHVLEGQRHDVAPEAIAPVLVEFFSA